MTTRRFAGVWWGLGSRRLLTLPALLFAAAFFAAPLVNAQIDAVGGHQTILDLAIGPTFTQQTLGEHRTSHNVQSRGLVFVENRGQWPDEVLYRAHLGGAEVWVTSVALVFDFYRNDGRGATFDGAQQEISYVTRRGHIVAMRFENALKARPSGQGLREAYHNYFVGDDPGRWVSRVPLYDEVVLKELYDGVDLRLYDDGGFLRYDFVVAPGADPSQVRVQMVGAETVSLTEGGVLRMETSLGPVEHRGLLTYQERAGRRRDVLASAFKVGTDGSIGFEVQGADPERELVIDPQIWATFLGGANVDGASAVAVGTDGSATVAGWTRSPSFPTTIGAYDVSYNGSDGFITRLSPDGTTLFWSTFIGGSSSDGLHGVAVGADGSAIAAGGTNSADFPTTPGALDTSYNGNSDAYVLRLSYDGAALIYSTFIGGSEVDGALEVAIGPDGSATVVGRTISTDFPTTPDAFDVSYNGGPVGIIDGDAFVSRLSPDGATLIWSSFLGGAENDHATNIAVGADGSATVAGNTQSADFPTTPGAFDPTNNSHDAFVARLAPDGRTLVWSTFFGGGDWDTVFGVAIGPEGATTIAGETNGQGIPVTPGAFSSCTPFGDAYAARLSPDGTALLYATCLGGSRPDWALDVAVGVDGSAVVVGYTESSDFPMTPNAYDESFGGAIDGYVARLNAGGTALLYASYLGGADGELAYGVDIGVDGLAVVAGSTQSPDFLMTSNAYDTSYNGSEDAFVVRLDVGLPPPNQSPIAEAGPDQTVDCASPGGANVTLDGSASSDPDGDPLTFSWAEGDTELATGPTPTVTLVTGTHTLTLTVADPGGLSDTDEVVITVVADTEPPVIDVTAAPLVLWPANHAYHTVALADLGLAASDGCDGTLGPGDVVIASVSSDEPENGPGDGDTTDDIVIGSDCRSVMVRAERQGAGNGRVYTLRLAVADAAGNTAETTYEVRVPKSPNRAAVNDGPSRGYTVACASQAARASSPVAEAAPATFALHAAYPNPFGASATIPFETPEATSVRLVVFDVLGREVAVLIDGWVEPSHHEAKLDASGLPSGVYLVRMTTGTGFTQTQRVTLMR